MNKHTASLGLALVAAASILPGIAEAAPLGTVPAGPEAAARAGSDLRPVLLVRRCHTRYGVRHCRWIDGAVRPYRWYDPNRFPTGSTAWWRQMELEGRAGFRK